MPHKVVYGVSGAIFLVQKNWRQKLAGIEDVLFQASFCRETPPLIGRSTGDWIFIARQHTAADARY